jgi:hypothetical protein
MILLNIFILRLILFRSPLLKESRLIYIPIATKMFQFAMYFSSQFPEWEISISKYLH